MNRVEAHAADAITDSRLRVKVPAPWVFRALGKKTVEVPVPFPTGQTLARMARLFCRMDIELKELKAGDMGTTLECIGRNAVTVSRIITHQLIGALPRWRGSSDAWTLIVPSLGTSRIS